MNYKYIVVHGGKAHLDDLFACGLVMATKEPGTLLAEIDHPLPIYRRDPTPEELNDPEVVVLDVGRSLDKSHSNWDHHQLERGTRDCAMSLLSKDIIVPGGKDADDSFYEVLKLLYGWFEARVDLDANGPFVAAKRMGTEWKYVSPFLGPFEDMILDMFTDGTPGERGNWVYTHVARKISREIEAYFAVRDAINHYRVLENCLAGPIDIFDFRAADPDQCELVSGALLSGCESGVAVFHAKPRREGETWESTGLTLMRIKDDPRVDFSRVEYCPTLVKDNGVTFVHKSGFLLATADKNADVQHLVITAAKGGMA